MKAIKPVSTLIKPQQARAIELRGLRTHNLKSVDLDLPLRKLIVVTGVSGAGKSSLALDTLYAEGQRQIGRASWNSVIVPTVLRPECRP